MTAKDSLRSSIDETMSLSTTATPPAGQKQQQQQQPSSSFSSSSSSQSKSTTTTIPTATSSDYRPGDGKTMKLIDDEDTSKTFTRSRQVAVAIATSSSEYSPKNVYGDDLQPCSSNGMALTGYTRTGYCVDENHDNGSHHICIDLSSTQGGNFCEVTGQTVPTNWCESSDMSCHNDPSQETCSPQHWCVCQWAFADYIQKANGCDSIQDIICDSINEKAMLAYIKKQNRAQKYQDALDCLVSRCSITLPSAEKDEETSMVSPASSASEGSIASALPASTTASQKSVDASTTIRECTLNPCPDVSSKCISYNDIVYCSCPYVSQEQMGGYALGLTGHSGGNGQQAARCSSDLENREQLGWFIRSNTSEAICSNPSMACPASAIDCVPFDGIPYCLCPTNGGVFTPYYQKCASGDGNNKSYVNYEDDLMKRKWIAIMIPVLFALIVLIWFCCGKNKHVSPSAAGRGRGGSTGHYVVGKRELIGTSDCC